MANRQGRRDDMSYFAPPFDRMPYGNTYTSSSAPPVVDRLAQAALAASLH
ncbi:hypothetical protein [Luteibacter yeojuensis]|uniref:Uncharacterized protein n=1 Tax=Luteibacter yeojuensis TaxID=345309 RepID=A0A7X5TQW9_9GAMM|nr:hypothetical protein [Luteibacter yeojuensis]NID16996.1 hypothetical protein [Luteibacter yeojuensis]